MLDSLETEAPTEDIDGNYMCVSGAGLCVAVWLTVSGQNDVDLIVKGLVVREIGAHRKYLHVSLFQLVHLKQIGPTLIIISDNLKKGWEGGWVQFFKPS